MEENKEIVNKVASNTSLALIDLELLYPSLVIEEFDIKPYLFMEMILKEKDFRESLKQIDWKQYRNKAVYIHCSADTIVPVWAYMLVASYLTPYASTYVLGNEDVIEAKLWNDEIDKIDFSQYQSKKVLVKGCSDKPVPDFVFVEISKRVLPIVTSLMYGEACSGVGVSVYYVNCS